MTVLGLLLKGLLAGFAIAAPVGPVNVLCVSRTLTKGWRAALASGLGAATADAFYGSIAGFSITFVIQLLVLEKFWIRSIGGALLVAVGVSYYFKPPAALKESEAVTSKRSDFMSAWLLTMTNPSTVLTFLAVLAALHVNGESWWLTWLLVVGIFSGSLLWWLILITAVNRFRGRFNTRALSWMNRVAGLAIGGFGVFTFLLSFSASR